MCATALVGVARFLRIGFDWQGSSTGELGSCPGTVPVLLSFGFSPCLFVCTCSFSFFFCGSPHFLVSSSTRKSCAFTLDNLLDKPWSQASFLLNTPPPPPPPAPVHAFIVITHKVGFPIIYFFGGGVVTFAEFCIDFYYNSIYPGTTFRSQRLVLSFFLFKKQKKQLLGEMCRPVLPYRCTQNIHYLVTRGAPHLAPDLTLD